MTDQDVKLKLAAILAADVAGYSRLMGDDERATVATLDDYRAVFRHHIDAHGGRVVDMAGDSVLSVFENAIGAAQAAIDIQADLATRNQSLPGHRAMHFRIGINLGDMIEKADGTVYGDGVNVAARLEALAQPGGVNISGSVHDSVRSKLDRSFDDLGEHSVKNIADPVRAYRILAEGEVPATPPRRNRLALVAGLAMVALIVAGWLGGWWLTRDTSPQMIAADGTPTDDPVIAMPSGPAIAVLPFNDLSSDGSEQFFAQGLSAEIANALSRSELRVTAQGSAAAYQGSTTTRKQIATELGVQFILSGSVNRSADRLRVQAQLHDSANEQLLWGETYERDLSVVHLFDVQDDIAERVVATIAGDFGAVNMLAYEGLSRHPPESVAAYECVLLFLKYNLALSEEGSNATRSCLLAALETEPDYADAWAALAEIDADRAAFGWEDYDEYIGIAETEARMAIKLDSQNQRAHWTLAYIFFLTHRMEQFFREVEVALGINSNNPNLIGNIGAILVWAGDWDRGGRLLTKAFELDPVHPPWQNYPYIMWHMRDGRLEDALALAHTTESAMPDWYWSPVNVAVALGHMERLEDATVAMKRAVELNPDFAANARDEVNVWVRDQEFVEFYLEGLRKAGVDVPAESELTN